MPLKAEARTFRVEGDVFYKTYASEAEAWAEAQWYQMVPWACPELLGVSGGTLAVRRHEVACDLPAWRPAGQLRDLLGRLHGMGIHHRDVHTRNVVRGADGRPLLIDWESATRQVSRFSYDLCGPVVSGVGLPDIHDLPQWWGCGGAFSIGSHWGHIVYQPWFRNGDTIGKSQRDATGRYEAIAKRLEGRSGFSVLDFGAYSGYFALRLAHDFNATATAVDADAHLAQGLEIGGDPRVTGIHRFLELEEVKGLGSYDVGLCLSVLHHLPWWRELVAALREQCGELFIETASPDEQLPTRAEADRPAVEALMRDMGGEIIAQTAGFGSDVPRPLWHILPVRALEPVAAAPKRRRRK